MKIYTKTGDGGETSLGNGTRLKKDSLRVNAYGELDELNAQIGVCRALNRQGLGDVFLEKILLQLQQDCMVIGSDLASPSNKQVGGKMIPRLTEESVAQLEYWIDELDQHLESLQYFILPGGSLLAAELHLARTICRRTERSFVKLFHDDPQKKAEVFVLEIGDEKISTCDARSHLIYINRLSDLFFMMARWANQQAKIADEKWISRES